MWYMGCPYCLSVEPESAIGTFLSSGPFPPPNSDKNGLCSQCRDYMKALEPTAWDAWRTWWCHSDAQWGPGNLFWLLSPAQTSSVFMSLPGQYSTSPKIAHPSMTHWLYWGDIKWGPSPIPVSTDLSSQEAGCPLPRTDLHLQRSPTELPAHPSQSKLSCMNVKA